MMLGRRQLLPQARLGTVIAVGLVSSALGLPAEAKGQALTVAEIESMLQQGVSENRVLEIAGQYCISFAVTSAVRRRLTRAGASMQFLDGLVEVCIPARRPEPRDPKPSQPSQSNRPKQSEPPGYFGFGAGVITLSELYDYRPAVFGGVAELGLGSRALGVRGRMGAYSSVSETDTDNVSFLWDISLLFGSDQVYFGVGWGGTRIGSITATGLSFAFGLEWPAGDGAIGLEFGLVPVGDPVADTTAMAGNITAVLRFGGQ